MTLQPDVSSVPDTALAATVLELVNATSVSPDTEAGSAALTGLLTTHGFDVRTDDWGNVLGRMVFGPGPTVLYDAHVDTVEVGDPAGWRYDPRGEQVGDRIVGRGTVDTKGPLAAAIHAADRLRDDPTVSGTLIVSGSVDEELAEGPALGRILDDVSPDVVVIGEPSGNVLHIGQRGRAEVVVEVIGVSSHSAFPTAGVNAVEVMADLLQALRSMPFRADANLGSGQLTLVSIRSAPYPSQSTVPSSCVAVFDRRTVVGETEEQVLDEVRSIVEPIARANDARVEVSLARARWRTWRGHDVDVPVFAPAWHQAADSWPVDQVVAGLERRGLPSATSTWPFCTHGSESAGHRRIPTIGYGPGDPSLAHTADESISMTQLQRGVEGYHAIFTSLLHQDGAAGSSLPAPS
ncbi:YgeY family selenium metabolism-linked hydrolase [Gordonia sp. CPCC 206044]|uniref:YgeY family selenium metabolism-linked hydrolase n=1 Tax=Gordonia sp. CPCC 206044 TaxID=3140793 RepID=UPI003AF3EEF1